MSFSRRHIDVTFQLGQGSFGEGGFDTEKVSGLRVVANITKAGGAGLNTANIRIYGLPLSLMSKLAIVGNQLIQGRNNLITVAAGSDDAPMATCFTGVINQSWPNFQAAPDVSLDVTASPTLLDALKPVPPISFQGSADVATIMSGLAAQMGMTLESNGVQVKLAPGKYFAGTAPAQARKVAQAAGINLLFDDNNVMAIWTTGTARGSQAQVISKDTGMVGYPNWSQGGILVKSLYNPLLQFGGNVQVNSTLTQATGQWNIFNVNHNLESEVPNGAWFTTVECSKFSGGNLPIAQ